MAIIILIVTSCSDAADALAAEAQGRWRCEQGDDPRWKPFEVEIGDGTFIWYDADGSVYAESTWSLDGGDLRLGLQNAAGPVEISGVETGSDRITTRFEPDRAKDVDVEVITDDEVTFRERAESAVTWTCRRKSL